MSRPSKPIAKGPAFVKKDAPDPANSLPQVTPDTTDAASAEAAAASVDPKPDAAQIPPVTPPAPPAEAKTRKPAQPVVLRVKGPANGRWRAGRHFTPDPANSLPQVTPDTTDAASADAKAAAEAAAASVDPKPDAAQIPPVTPPAPPAEAKTRKPAQPVVLRVKGPANGRWRAGRHFTPEPVDIPMDDLSDEDLAKLNGDPALTCTVIGAPA